MKKELEYFHIGNSYGGQQEWFADYWMRIGGCAAVTACDCSIYFELYRDKHNLYPNNIHKITQKDYIRFSNVMKPYLRPRETGIDKLDTYIEGFDSYLQEEGEHTITMTPWPGKNPIESTNEIVKQQIDNGFPIPCLTLEHTKPSFRPYVWHWFLIAGYEEYGETLMVKLVTYGTWHWVSLNDLWDTGYKRKGGLILFGENEETEFEEA